MTPWKLGMHFETDLQTLRVVRKLVASMARMEGMDDVGTHLIEVAMGEALSNARLHAYQNAVGPIEVATESDGTTFTVTVRNHGRAVSGRMGIPETAAKQDSRGWGLYIMGRLMDEVEVMSIPHGELGTAVRMAKRLNRP